ncbi:MAG: dockerin type I repeat-containing protein [Ruminococcus sp.]|nr:dockerin type I repeat-containing protein [Ruminococcus sp.]
MKKIISIILVLTLLCSVVPFTVYAADDNKYKSKRDELIALYLDVKESIETVGYYDPYSENSLNMLFNAFISADELLEDDSDSISDMEYQLCFAMLNFAYNNLCVDVFYAKETYVLSLNEHNENGFYDENDWNDFVTKRDNLRDSFKTGNEYVISYAFFELVDSFIDMTSKYTLPGDVNNDGKISVDDATLVQKYLAGVEELTELQQGLASLSGTCYYAVSKVNIDTVTRLQKCSAGLFQPSSKHYSYGETYVDNFGNTFNTMITMDWEYIDYRYEYVDAKVSELEADGVI